MHQPARARSSGEGEICPSRLAYPWAQLLGAHQHPAGRIGWQLPSTGRVKTELAASGVPNFLKSCGVPWRLPGWAGIPVNPALTPAVAPFVLFRPMAWFPRVLRTPPKPFGMVAALLGLGARLFPRQQQHGQHSCDRTLVRFLVAGASHGRPGVLGAASTNERLQCPHSALSAPD